MNARMGWTCAVVAVGFLGADPVPQTEPDPHWMKLAGPEWRGMSPEAKQAYAAGFLTGSALSEATAAGAKDSGSIVGALDSLRGAGFRYPYAPNVYLARIDDYYWWENHRPAPIWNAFREVNDDLRRLAGRDSQ